MKKKGIVWFRSEPIAEGHYLIENPRRRYTTTPSSANRADGRLKKNKSNLIFLSSPRAAVSDHLGPSITGNRREREARSGEKNTTIG